MARRLATRVIDAVRRLARWYLTPTGGAFALAMIVGTVMAATVSRPVGLAVVVAAVAVVVPHKLMHLEQGRVQARGSIGQLKVSTRALNESLSAVDRRVTAAEQQLDELRSAAETWRESLSIADAELAERLDTCAAGVEALRTSLDRHRSRVTLSLARRDGRSRPVRRVILLVCAQRVGSTWLFDLLRQHPRIDVHPTADIFRRLGVDGRRYPLHLTDVVDAGLEIEVGERIGGVIPSFPTTMPPQPGSEPGDPDPYYIEKLHPPFIAFDVDAFVGRVATLREQLGGDDRVVTVFPIREPSESIRSFLSYRRRDPNWSQDVPVSGLHDFYRRSFEAVAVLHERLPGPVVAYEDLSRDPAGTVAALLVQIGVAPVDERQVASYVHATAEHRERTASPFFCSGNDEPSLVDVEVGTGSDDPAQARESLARCRELYRVLVDRGTALRPIVDSR